MLGLNGCFRKQIVFTDAMNHIFSTAGFVGYAFASLVCMSTVFAIQVAWFPLALLYGFTWIPCSLYSRYSLQGEQEEEDYITSFRTNLVLTFLWPLSVFLGLVDTFQGED